MAKSILNGDQIIQGNLEVTGNVVITGTKPTIPRDSIEQTELARFEIPFTQFRVHDDFNANLPNAGAADDLGIIAGTFGSASPTLQTGDLKAAGATTRYARVLVPLPAEYDAGQSVTLRINAGMETTVADTSATVDVEAYESDSEGGIGSDLCATAAQSINSLTYAQKDFTITPTSLVAGDLLDIRIAVAVSDGATGTAVIGSIGSIALLCDIRG